MTAPFAHLEPGSIFAGDFRVVAPLKAGGMGAVYLAEQLSTGKQRALKLMLPQLTSNEPGPFWEAFMQPTLTKERPALQRCYRQGLARHPDLKGTVFVHVTVDAGGAVTSATDSGGDLPDPVVIACVTGVLSHAHFDVPHVGLPGLYDAPFGPRTFDVPVRFEPSAKTP